MSTLDLFDQNTGKFEQLNLKNFLETKYLMKCNEHNECDPKSYFENWSKQFDYENWRICNLIGNGAYAKVYQVKHMRTTGNVTQEKTYAMKAIKKNRVKD